MKERARASTIRGLVAAALGFLTLALYLPALTHSFIEYDDQQYVTENARVLGGLTKPGFRWAFGFHASNWHPLAWLSHMLDVQLYGTNPMGHHLTNVLLHAASTVLLFLFLQRVTGALWRSAMVAAIFGWHPLHVESVAWIAERKDVLCAFFWMLTLNAYARYAHEFKVQGSRFKVFYLITLLCFALALMAKPMAITLPFVLLLLDYWPLQRIKNFLPAQNESVEEAAAIPLTSIPTLVLEKIPFFVLSAVSAVLTMRAQQQSIVSTSGLPVGQRIGHTFLAYLHYLEVALVPRHLAVYEPYDITTPVSAAVLAATVIFIITVLAVAFVRRWPCLAIGWFWYLGTLVPVIGLVQVGDQAWADRYTYLPLIGVSVSLVWGLFALIQRERILWAAAAAAGAGMLLGTSLQLRYWKDTRTLFAHAYAVTHENYLALTVLGSEQAKAGNLNEAIKDYQLALKLKPGFPEAYFFLGNALEQQGKLDDAVAAYQRALWYKPIQEQTHIFLAMVLARQQKMDEAIAHYEAALKANPDSAVAHNNLARLLHTQGRLDDAILQYRAALELDPKLALAHNNLGILMLQKGQVDAGVQQLREALRLKPDNVETEQNLAMALDQQGKWADAAGLFKKVVGPACTDPQLRYEFATALAHLGKTREAMSQYAAALITKADFPAALDGLSWILATAPNPEFRNGEQAVQMSQQACQLTGRKNPVMLKTLAAAYAETGKFQEAIVTVKEARELALAANSKKLADECAQLMEQFQASKPWRETSIPAGG